MAETAARKSFHKSRVRDQESRYWRRERQACQGHAVAPSHRDGETQYAQDWHDPHASGRDGNDCWCPSGRTILCHGCCSDCSTCHSTVPQVRCFKVSPSIRSRPLTSAAACARAAGRRASIVWHCGALTICTQRKRAGRSCAFTRQTSSLLHQSSIWTAGRVSSARLAATSFSPLKYS